MSPAQKGAGEVPEHIGSGVLVSLGTESSGKGKTLEARETGIEALEGCGEWAS